MANRILCISGSTRKKSLNKQLSRQACEYAREAGAESTFIDLADFAMPIYNGDDEAATGLPDTAIELQDIFRQHDALIIASPEYNSSYSALLKNTLDWISRPNGSNDTQVSPFSQKVAGLVAASPGGFGGLRGLMPLRMLLGNIGVTVVPQQLAIASAFGKIDENGRFTDDAAIDSLKGIINAIIATRLDS